MPAVATALFVIIVAYFCAPATVRREIGFVIAYIRVVGFWGLVYQIVSRGRWSVRLQAAEEGQGRIGCLE